MLILPLGAWICREADKVVSTADEPEGREWRVASGARRARAARGGVAWISLGKWLGERKDMSVALPLHPHEGPEAVDFQGEPVCCESCSCSKPETSARCERGHACVHDRYSVRVARFFTWNPRQADAWLSHPYFEVRALAARHGSVFRLSALLDDPDETVRASVATRVPQSLLRRLINDPHREVRIRVAQRLAAPSLVAMLKDPDYYVRVWVARRIPETFLARLSEDAESEVRAEVAERLSPGALILLLRDPDPRIRRCVARRAPPAQLALLAQDPAWEVRWEVAQRANDRLCEVLSRDPESEVRNAALQRLTELGRGEP
jgi:hypothetical protein